MHNQKGFTLIELLLYIGISGIVLFSLSVFFSVLLNSRIKSETVAEVDGQGMAIMSLMTQSIRNADSISLPVAGASGSSLTLLIDDVASSPMIYSVVDNTLMMTSGLDAPVALTNGNVQVTGFQIENTSRVGTRGNVRITFTLSRLNLSGGNEYDYAQTFEGSASLR